MLNARQVLIRIYRGIRELIQSSHRLCALCGKKRLNHQGHQGHKGGDEIEVLIRRLRRLLRRPEAHFREIRELIITKRGVNTNDTN
jgi:hypothetical protein